MLGCIGGRYRGRCLYNPNEWEAHFSQLMKFPQILLFAGFLRWLFKANFYVYVFLNCLPFTQIFPRSHGNGRIAGVCYFRKSIQLQFFHRLFLCSTWISCLCLAAPILSNVIKVTFFIFCHTNSFGFGFLPVFAGSDCCYTPLGFTLFLLRTR